MDDEDREYPCTIIPARYGGCYEDAQWLALPCEHWVVPREVTGEDGDCATFFGTRGYGPAHRMVPFIGRGETPDASLSDMLAKRSRLGRWEP